MFWANRDGRRHPGGRRAGCPHPAGPCGGADVPILKLPRCGGRERPPYGAGANAAADREIAAAQGPAGGYGIRPYDRRHGARPNGKPQPCGVANPCRGRCLHRPGKLYAARTPAGGINPAPTGKFYVLNQPGRLRPPGRPQGGMPSSRRTPRRREPRGRIWNPPLQPTVGPWPTGKPQTLRYIKPL